MSDDLGLLLVMLAIGSRRQQPTSKPSESEALPDESPDGTDLFKPNDRSAMDELWESYVLDPKRAGPRLQVDTAPVARKLTEFELWALRPYFPVAGDLDFTLHVGQIPPCPPDVTPSYWDITMRTAVAAKTMPDGSIWVPQMWPLWHRRWLGVLAHEITHRAQQRMGSTTEEQIRAMHEHGYVESPIEVQARWMQRRVLRDLVARARAGGAR